MIKRYCEIEFNNIKKGIVHVIYGPRRSGKTTFVKKLIDKNPRSLYVI